MRPRYFWLIGIFFLLGVSLFATLHFISQRKETEKKIIYKEGIYRVGDISVDTKKGQIQFKAKISKNKGWVQHLLYLEGYKWLKEESAIVSGVKLSDLQKAIALLDGRPSDEFWYKKIQESPAKRDPASRKKNQNLIMFIKWNEKEIFAKDLVSAEDELGVEDLIFLGSSYFDPIALEAPAGVDCRLCPLFSLEEKALREIFLRESGKSGYELNQEKMPLPGTEVYIIIRLFK